MNARIIATGEIKSFFPTRQSGYDGYVDADGRFYYPTELDFRNGGKTTRPNYPDLVTYEQAVKLKALGFDGECCDCYLTHKESVATQLQNYPSKMKWNSAKIGGAKYGYTHTSAPRIEQVQEWLISKGYFIAVEWYSENVWKYGIYKNARPAFFNNTMKPSYKEIMTSAITEALNLIEHDEMV